MNEAFRDFPTRRVALSFGFINATRAVGFVNMATGIAARGYLLLVAVAFIDSKGGLDRGDCGNHGMRSPPIGARGMRS